MRQNKLVYYAGITVFAMLLIFSISRIKVWADPSQPGVSAKAAVIYNPQTGEVIFEKNARQRLPMASTTKIMSAMLALEQDGLDDEFVVDSEAIKAEGSSMGLLEGDIVTLRALVCGMLLPSGNDAANAAAVRIAGNIDGFVEMMNERAQLLGLEDTHFVTPSGLDDYTDEHFSTAYDMARLAACALENEDFRAICSQQRMQVRYGNPPYNRWLANTNKLLKNEGVIGVKTGFTDKARRCLVSACERDGAMLICVTLNAPDDWNDHMKLYDYGFGRLSQKQLKLKRETVEIKAVGGTSENVRCTIPAGSALLTNGAEKRVSAVIYVPQFVYAPVKRGDAVGRVVFTLDGKKICEVALTADEDIAALVREESTLEKFFGQLAVKYRAFCARNAIGIRLGGVGCSRLIHS